MPDATTGAGGDDGSRRRRAPRSAPCATSRAPRRFAQALTLLAVGFAFSTHAVRSLIGWPGLLAALAGLLALCVLSLIARWRAVEWYGILPITILVFVGWCAASVLWSDPRRPGATAVRVLYLVAFAFIGVYVALMRDTIQIVRAFGDVMRVLLGRLDRARGALRHPARRADRDPRHPGRPREARTHPGPLRVTQHARVRRAHRAAHLHRRVAHEDRAARPGDRVHRAGVAVHRALGLADDLDGARSRRSWPSPRSTACGAPRPPRAGGGRSRCSSPPSWSWSPLDRPHPDHRAPRRPRRVRRAPRRLAGALALPEPQPVAGLGLGRFLAGCRAVHLDRARHRPAARLGAQRVRRRLLPGRRDRRAHCSSPSSASHSCGRGCSPRAGAASSTSGRRSCSSSSR